MRAQDEVKVLSESMKRMQSMLHDLKISRCES